MADSPDRHAFDVVSAPIGTSGAEFQDIAKTVAGVDTLDGFLRDMRARYPDLSTRRRRQGAAAAAAPPKAKPQASAPPRGARTKRRSMRRQSPRPRLAAAAEAGGRRASATTPTGSIPGMAKPRLAARFAGYVP